MSVPWRDDRNETVLQWVSRIPLWPLAWLWNAGSGLHRLGYERGWWVARRLDCKVVSIGALQAGGTGKTPVAIAVARLLRDRRGVSAAGRVVVASRGHGRRGSRSDPVVCVSDGSRIVAEVERAGDEPLLVASQVPGVSVYVARDRGLAGEAALAALAARAPDAEPSSLTLLLDDGFQHHRLDRDLDLVVIDASAGLGRACLPRGTRREGLRALGRADGIVVIDGPLGERDRSRLERHAPGVPHFAAARRLRGSRPLGNARKKPARLFRRRAVSGPTSLADLAGREVGIFTGIGRPDSFRRSVEGLGAHVIGERVFADHHRYRAAEFRDAWLREAPLWLTTAKDASKLRPSWTRGVPVLVLDMEVELSRPGELLAWLNTRLAGPD